MSHVASITGVVVIVVVEKYILLYLWSCTISSKTESIFVSDSGVTIALLL